MPSRSRTLAIRLQLSALLILTAPREACADLSFVQIVQGQTSRGLDGIFGKTWVELKGDKMRLVSGYARKIRKGKKETDPRRIVQIIDLAGPEHLLLYPENKTYARAPLKKIAYGNKMGDSLAKGKTEWKITDRVISLTKMKNSRKLMGTECSHYRLNVRMTLSGPDRREVVSRMEQHVWVAPLSGNLSQTVLDLIAFENAYRIKAGGALSPIDHERYQIREAAAYLQVADWDLQPIVESVRERLRELPSYPIASSVSWWRDQEIPRPPKAVELPRLPSGTESPPDRRTRPSRISRPVPLFKAINWSRSEKRINKMYSRTRRQVGIGSFPRAVPVSVRPHQAANPGEEPVVYSKFEQELQKVLHLLIREQEEGFSEISQEEERPLPRPEGKKAEVPFYEIYTELHGLEGHATLGKENFKVPAGYKEVELPGKS